MPFQVSVAEQLRIVSQTGVTEVTSREEMKELAQSDLVRFSARPGSWSSGFSASWFLEFMYKGNPFAVLPFSTPQVDSENRTAERSCNGFSKKWISCPSTHFLAFSRLPRSHHCQLTSQPRQIPYASRILSPYRNVSLLHTCFTSRPAWQLSTLRNTPFPPGGGFW